jgi:hypothetical protein
LFGWTVWGKKRGKRGQRPIQGDSEGLREREGLLCGSKSGLETFL